MSETRHLRNDIVAIVLLAVVVFLAASLATYDPADPVVDAFPSLRSVYQPDQLVYPLNESFDNACGRLGAWVADLLLTTLGVGTYLIVIGLISLEVALFRHQPIQAPWLKTLGWLLSLIGICTFAAAVFPRWMTPAVIGPGGYLGVLVHIALSDLVGSAGSILVAVSALVVGMMMWTEYLVFRAGRLMFAPAFAAATSLLPFGYLHRFVLWFNGTSTVAMDPQSATDEDDDEVGKTDLPRRIRINGATLVDDPDSTESESDADADEEELLDDEEAGADDEEESDEEVEDVDEDDAEEPEADASEPSAAPSPHFKIPKPVRKSERDLVLSQLNEADKLETDIDYELPSIELLHKSDAVPFEAQKQEALEKARILEKTCMEFGYRVKVVEIETGPVISQYEIQLEAGLRLNKITALADDLAIALRVPSVRIVAPIPGKNTVGVEVPNETRKLVCLRDLMEQSQNKARKMNIPVFLGADAVGQPLVVDLAKMPHLLIAGRTGTGKSVCLNAIITSILMTRRPDEVRMLMIDPKMVELSGYGRLPHLMHPVVTDMRKAEAILAWAVDKMEERYKLLARAGVRHINSYNQLGEEELMERLQPQDQLERDQIPTNLPFIVIVADEMADLMMTAGKEVEQHIIRLAQKSRAVGIHLILATQKPTVDVITGLIKSNLPARLAFQVASKTDSRVVLDAMGADKLLGNGDMLFLWPGTSTLIRGQGTYVTDEEIDAITASVSTGEQNFVHELVNMKVGQEGSDDPGAALKNRDELYEKAIDVVVSEQRGSVSLLQRALGIGYGRAARLIDYMEEDGFVGTYNGSKSREVLLDPETWAAMKRGGAEPEPPTTVSLQATQAGRTTMMAANQKTSASTAPAAPKRSTTKRTAADDTADDEFVEDDSEDLQDDVPFDVEDVDAEVAESEDEYEDLDDQEYGDEEYEDVDDEEEDWDEEDEEEEHEEEFDVDEDDSLYDDEYEDVDDDEYEDVDDDED